MSDASTETGIDLSKYIEEKTAGIVQITKNGTSGGNYIYARTPYVVQLVNGVPTAVSSSPTVMNINKLSVATIREKVLAEKLKLDTILLQLAAIDTDMDALG